MPPKQDQGSTKKTTQTQTEIDGTKNVSSRVKSVGAAAKRKKTGGRASKPLDQKLAEGKARSVIASWDDDTTLDSELTALYLCISGKKLEELRGQWNKASGGHGAAGPAIIKIFDKGATGQNQPVLYKLGALREFQRKVTAPDSFNAAVNAGLAAWATVQRPFFAVPEQTGISTRLVADAWDLDDAQREANFAALLQGRLRVLWMSADRAARSVWTNHSKHSTFAESAVKYLHEEQVLIHNALANTIRESELSTGSLTAVEEYGRQ